MLTQVSKLGIKFVKRQEPTRRFGKRKFNRVDKFPRLDRFVALNIPGNPNQPINKIVERQIPGEIVNKVAANCRL